MAGDWIKMRVDLADDPAVIAIAAATDLDEDAVVGKLHRLWSWADRQSRDGHANGVTTAWLNRYVRCDGFAESMLQYGWLAVEKGGVSFPNFDRHNGKTAKTRALATDRKATQRSREERDKSVTREEKRREVLDASPQEERGEQRTASRSRPAASKVTWSEAGFTTPADILAAMGVAYPGVNLLHEIGKAHAWVLSNPARRKSDWGRFLNSWMSRAHGDLKRQVVPASGAGAASHSIQRAQQVREEGKAAAAAMAPMPESIRAVLPRRPAGEPA